MSTVSPANLAHALGLPAPTAEQEAVIAAPPGPNLVVAGAGAGKTETMAARVIWMVANRLVLPDQVLGLTFTRKAAQQLGARIRSRLARLAGSPLLRELDTSGELRETITNSAPEVSTYHAYAGRLLGEHGLLLPVEPTATVLGETQLWQLAFQVVSSWDGDLDTERVPTTITDAVLALSGQLAEHLVEPEQLVEAHTELEKLVMSLPPGPGKRQGPTRDLLNIIDTQRERAMLLPLVARLQERLRERGALDFGSQMSLAARLAAEHPEVGVAERERFRLVLLDEYQDTGHAQRVLLSALFGGVRRQRDFTVTAVGDPMQSIYGWRGASAANLPRFATDFPQSARKPADILPLLTSWRNPPQALTLANVIAEPLRHKGVPVDPLRPRPDARDGDVMLALTETVVEEREWVAQRIADAYAAASDKPPTAAVLIRRNADAAPIAEVLRAHGLPVEIVGLGGLLSTPEVADLVAMLRLAAEPASGSAAVRVLTGARWQLGLADIRALHLRAGELSIRHAVTNSDIADAQALAAALARTLPVEPSEQAGLADAIADPGPAERYSAAGYERITALGKELAALRERLGQPLPELVADIDRTIGIGIETQARQRTGSGGAGREHLDAFAEVVAGFAADAGATVGGLLAFLDAAQQVEDGLEPGEVEVAPDRVQVLTVHAAKGLEWEVVAVPHVVTGVFPSTTASGTWLGALGELPPSLRGDRVQPGESGEGIPELKLDSLADRGELEDEINRHKAALKQRKLDEDRRLFYVAVTRTERALYVSGHHWAETGSGPKGPSPFLAELRAALEASDAPLGRIDVWAPAPADGAVNPLTQSPVTAQWPADPLGSRRAAVQAGAAAVRAAMADPMPADEDPEGWAADVDALLAEHASAEDRGLDVELPAELAATQLVELRANPARLASLLRRPVPYPPDTLARRGTAFHAWVERRFGSTRLLDLDDLPGGVDGPDRVDDDLAALQESFLASKWADRTPIDVEVPFETTIAATVVRGRMDAVFADPDGGWTVVDWKTGAEPTGANQDAVAIQLAVYRLAWARLVAARTGEPESDVCQRVRAAFHYVRTGATVAPAKLPGLAELERLIESAGQP
ncbi:ATP-dependent helicase [Skermania sp. ID1734]|uniref:ATP-dependent helicase n=1 Tax=Skermania sp. ID1734 TaxID=2597516 RepID=UPI0011816434|nr:UvrD-helicase domain-containing protein [Skermania sp. ID1734]TSD97295.1 ATP-dependent helicase [Skermania sp. ID1734]